MSATFANAATNILYFHNSNLKTGFITTNNTIVLTPPSGYNIYANVLSVNAVANSVTLDTNTWLAFANVAYITANANTNIINIVSLTGSYNIINNGNYSNTAYPLIDIVYDGDTVNIANNPIQTVTGVNYVAGTITVQNNWSSNANSLLSVNRNYVVLSNDVLILTNH